MTNTSKQVIDQGPEAAHQGRKSRKEMKYQYAIYAPRKSPSRQPLPFPSPPTHHLTPPAPRRLPLKIESRLAKQAHPNFRAPWEQR